MSTPEPIAPEHARQRLDAAIRARVGDDWQEPESGWTRISGHDYMSRLVRGRTQIDFYVDLLGEVTVEEKELEASAGSDGCLILLLIGMALVGVVLMAARAVGLI